MKPEDQLQRPASRPAWQRRGVGLYWESFEKKGFNPKKKEEVTVLRRTIKQDLDLPTGSDYNAMILKLIARREAEGLARRKAGGQDGDVRG